MTCRDKDNDTEYSKTHSYSLRQRSRCNRHKPTDKSDHFGTPRQPDEKHNSNLSGNGEEISKHRIGIRQREGTFKRKKRSQASTHSAEEYQSANEQTSPFADEDSTVNATYNRFYQEHVLPDSEADQCYAIRASDDRLIVLNKDEFKDLYKNKPFWASATLIDCYLNFRLKRFPESILRRIHVPSVERLSANVQFDLILHQKFKYVKRALLDALKNVDYNLIPFNIGQHWSLVMVCGIGVDDRRKLSPEITYATPCILYFNSLKSSEMSKECISLIHEAVSEKSGCRARWHEIKVPQQTNFDDCGFFVVRYLVDFLKNLQSIPPKNVLDLMKGKRLEYKGPKIRLKFVRQLKGFLANDPYDRHWMPIEKHMELMNSYHYQREDDIV